MFYTSCLILQPCHLGFAINWKKSGPRPLQRGLRCGGQLPSVVAQTRWISFRRWRRSDCDAGAGAHGSPSGSPTIGWVLI